MLDPSQQLHEHILAALAPVNAWANAKGILGNVRADHIGFTCASDDEFRAMMERQAQEFAWVHTVLLSGRLVAYAKLRASAASAFGPVHFVEISAQKPDGSQASRFNHLEVACGGMKMETVVAHWRTRGVTGMPSGRIHHPTYDIVLDGGFEIRIEPEPLVEKIVREMLALGRIPGPNGPFSLSAERRNVDILSQIW